MNAEVLLSRLNKVRKAGNGSWIACCPAHNDKTPSLSIKEASDGRVLIHCHAECETEDILAAIGLTFSDIMPERLTNGALPPIDRPHNPSDMLKMLSFEATLVYLYAVDISKGNKISEEEHQRLLKAVVRIRTASEAANGR